MKMDPHLQNLQGKTIVITGAASGIGMQLAKLAALANMQLVLADINNFQLQQLTAELHAQGARVVSHVCDVTDEDQMNALADVCEKNFETPFAVINNAGIGGVIGPIWELNKDELVRSININLYGVIHGVRVFVPRLLKQNSIAHICNVSSMAGMYSAPFLSAYEIGKHGVVALTEALHHDLRWRESKIQVHLVCPGWVNTGILDQEIIQAMEKPLADRENISDADLNWLIQFAKSVKRGMSAADAAKIIFEEMFAGKFYIFTHPEMKTIVRDRLEAIMNDAAPVALEW